MKSLKYIIFSTLVLMAFKTGDTKNEYNVPYSAISITTCDLELDGDIDIIVGHNYNSQVNWGGLSTLLNNGEGVFIFGDSIYLYSWQTNITATNTNNTLFPEIIARNYENDVQYIAVIESIQNQFFINLFPMTYGISGNNIGDVDGNTYIDIVFYSNISQFWGVLYNDGSGNFSLPQYHDVEDYYPTDIVCADLNDDGRDDIVIVGQKTEVYFSYASGFQLLTLETNDYKSDVQIADIDKDGKNDIATIMQLYPYDYSLLKLYRNMGNNNIIVEDTIVFQPVCNGVFELSDFNNDSLPDFLFQNLINTELILYYNTGNFTLSSPQYIPVVNYGEGARRSSCADFDGNGYNDIATIRSWGAPLPANVNILFNDGQGNFVENPITGIKTPNSKYQKSITCFPNPFKSEINIDYQIKENSFVEISIYNLTGELINVLTQQKLKGGEHIIKWNGLDTGGKPCKPGAYLLTLKVNGNALKTIKLIKH